MGDGGLEQRRFGAHCQGKRHFLCSLKEEAPPGASHNLPSENRWQGRLVGTLRPRASTCEVDPQWVQLGPSGNSAHRHLTPDRPQPLALPSLTLGGFRPFPRSLLERSSRSRSWKGTESKVAPSRCSHPPAHSREQKEGVRRPKCVYGGGMKGRMEKQDGSGLEDTRRKGNMGRL